MLVNIWFDLAKSCVLESHNLRFNFLIFWIVWAVSIFEVTGQFLFTALSFTLSFKSFLTAFFKCFLFLSLFLFSTFWVNSSFHSKIPAFEFRPIFIFNCFLHSFFCFEHYITNAFAQESLRVTDQPYILNFTAFYKELSKFFLWDDERDISYENSSVKIVLLDLSLPFNILIDC